MTSAAVLLITAEPGLREGARRVAAAVGVEVVMGADAASMRRSWADAAAVVIGADAVDTVSSLRLGRRDHVVVITLAEPEWPEALAVGAEAVVLLPDDERDLVRRLSVAARPHRGRLIGVLPAAGGSGASTFAAGLAVALGETGREVLLVDADPCSGGIDLIVGADDVPGARWSDLATASGFLDPESLRLALPRAADVDVLAVDREAEVAVPESLCSVLDSARLGYDVVVVDLPRSGFPRDQVLPLCDDVLLVVTSDVRGSTTGRRVLRSLRHLPVRLAVRRVRHGVLDADEVAAWCETDLAVEIPDEPRIMRTLERGGGPVSARSRWAKVHRELAETVAPS